MLSELDAVNRMLLAIGSGVVNSITGTTNRDVAACKSILERARVNVLLEGWLYNIDEKVVVAPQQNGRIVVEENVLRIDLSPSVYQNTTLLDPVQRGGWLYNRVGHTYTWTASMTMDITRDLPWSELPESARQYVAAKGAEAAVTELEGDAAMIEKARFETLTARRNAKAQELSNSDLTIFGQDTEQRIRNQHLRR
jgi:hypothetical protein